MILVSQLLHAGVDVHQGIFFDQATSSTRGHKWKLKKPRAKSRIRRNAFATCVVNDWNSLPPSVVESHSLNFFKSNLDTYWADLVFAIPDDDRYILCLPGPEEFVN